MGRLEDIPKKQIFTVPDDYFDQLPAQVQSRIAHPEANEAIRPVFRLALQYALPVFILLLVAVYFLKPSPAGDTESILASVETTDLIGYLNETEVSTEDLLENIELYPSDLDAIESEVYGLYLDDTNVDAIADELKLNTP